MVRPPAVADRFYPAEPVRLAENIDELIETSSGVPPAVGCVAPHAGIMYSGKVAGSVYGRLELPPTVVLLGPNHYGLGSPLSLWGRGGWRTPLGEVSVDEDLAAKLFEACPLLVDDPVSHEREHSLEVQLPFLQRRRADVRIVPIVLSVGSYEPLVELGLALAGVVSPREPQPLLVASTDFSHYVPDETARVQDRKAIERILALDPERLYETVRRERITMCGYEPTVAVLTAARELDAKEGTLVKYATSGDAGGDRASVVGYAGLLLH